LKNPAASKLATGQGCCRAERDIGSGTPTQENPKAGDWDYIGCNQLYMDE